LPAERKATKSYTQEQRKKWKDSQNEDRFSKEERARELRIRPGDRKNMPNIGSLKQEGIDTQLYKEIKDLANKDIYLTRNIWSTAEKKERITKFPKESENERAVTFNGYQIPIRDTNDMWGEDFITQEDLLVLACTDGSTYRDKLSGSGVVYMEDHYHEREIWLTGSYWKIKQEDNYAAELAAINRAIRSVPITVPIGIYTDSDSSISNTENHRLPTLIHANKPSGKTIPHCDKKGNSGKRPEKSENKNMAREVSYREKREKVRRKCGCG
jgi:hypothetical protein